MQQTHTTPPSAEVPQPFQGAKGGAIRLDVNSIEQLLKTYPDPVHDGVRWLAQFTREECDLSLTVLSAKCRRIQMPKDTSTLYKIFTGRYFVPYTHGPRKGELIGSVENFAKLVEALQSQYRLEQNDGDVPFFETETSRQIFDYIDGRRMKGRVCKFGLILGPTGRQKSKSAKTYCMLNKFCVHVESPETPTMSKFITDLAARFGEARSSNQKKKLLAINSAVNWKYTIVVDNVQRLFNKKNGDKQPIFGFLMKLQDDTGCTVILIDVPGFEKELMIGREKGYFEQVVGRSGGKTRFLRLAPFSQRGDVIPAAKAFGLENPTDKECVSYLLRIAKQEGRDRILLQSLQEGQLVAQAEGKPFTLALLREMCGEDLTEVKEAA